MTPVTLIFAVALALTGGLCLGSFLNVVAYRLPAGLSLVSPGSACPGCGTHIRSYDNVPVISWLALGGQCRSCKTAISPRYPLTEAATGALFATVVIFRGGTRGVWLDLIFVAALVAITRIDLEHQIIPNVIVGPLALVALILTAVLVPGQLPERLIAAAGAGGLLLTAALAYPGGMGMGDVKLAAVMGLVLGRAVAPALLIAFLAGSAVGAALIIRHGAAARKTAVPFGPFLALGALIALFAGDAIVHAYLVGFGL